MAKVTVIECVHGNTYSVEKDSLQEAIEYTRYSAERELSSVVGILEGNKVWLPDTEYADIAVMQKAVERLGINVEGELILDGNYYLYPPDREDAL